MEDFENRMQIKIQDDIRNRELEQKQHKQLLDIEIQRWKKRYEDLQEEKVRYEENTT